MDERRCPDCGVTMDTGTLVSSVDREAVKLRTDESAGGVLGKLGVNETCRLQRGPVRSAGSFACTPSRPEPDTVLAPTNDPRI